MIRDSSEEVRNKIRDLFEYRKIPWLIELGGHSDPEKLSMLLTELQLAIYELDHQLESRWELTLPDLKPYWVEIYRQLAILGLSPNQQRTWTDEIVRYQNRELDIRKGKSPLKHSLEDLYCFKSCDVRLMRRIIYWQNPSLNEILKFSEWTEFDLITEVNDDTEDLMEDLATLNGNRLLFSLAEMGSEETRQIYKKFIDDRLIRSVNRLENSSSLQKDSMIRWVKDVAAGTLVLLEQQIGRLTEVEIAESPVIKAYFAAKLTSA